MAGSYYYTTITTTECPKCGVKPGKWCAEPSGRRKSKPHVERTVAYAEAQKKGEKIADALHVKSIRCKDCGYTRERFHGWAFAVGICTIKSSLPGSIKYEMLHNWEEVE